MVSAPLVTGGEPVARVNATTRLNIRSGPGLDYQMVTKVRGNESQAGTVVVVGRTADSQWLAVDERVAAQGWVTSNSSFVQCSSCESRLAFCSA